MSKTESLTQIIKNISPLLLTDESSLGASDKAWKKTPFLIREFESQWIVFFQSAVFVVFATISLQKLSSCLNQHWCRLWQEIVFWQKNTKLLLILEIYACAKMLDRKPKIFILLVVWGSIFAEPDFESWLLSSDDGSGLISLLDAEDGRRFGYRDKLCGENALYELS